ncbi:MAG TPA: 50S ribosomal protein L25 [Candidatus Limnocylindria bacterium]|nr:50S ribosomal protein L25 [Candidatus Limnocylindria bacterium]
MAEAQTLAVRPRQVVGKKVAQLRRDGVLPGVVFGGRKDSTSVQTDLRSFERSYRRWGNTTLLSLEGLDGDAIPALIHGVARDTLTGRLLHVDFQRVSLTEKTHAEVPLHFVHESPAVKTLGAVLVHARDHVTVEAFPQDIPHSIDVDLQPLIEIDDALYVRDLVVDKTTVRITDDLDELVVKAVPVRIEEEPVVAAAVPAEGEVPVEGAEAPAEGAAPAAPGAAAPAAAAGKPGAPAGAKPGAPAGAKPGAPGAKPGAPAGKPGAPAPKGEAPKKG